MDDLSTLLRAASDNAPPTSIDLDELITAERRRRRSRWAAVAAGAAVVVTAGISVTLAGSSPSPTVATPPAAAPTTSRTPCVHPTPPDFVKDVTIVPRNGPLPETADVAAERLTAALPSLLPPGARPSPKTKCGRVEFFYEPKADEYRAAAVLGDGSWAVMVRPAAVDSAPACLNPADPSCTRTDLPDGAVAFSDVMDLGLSREQRAVTVFRPDGTVVQVVAAGPPAELPAVADLTRTGTSPRLTLYP
ncbi:hypothetical protein [Actinoplanes solisilvae]|uniref:hypothetical protein n=1 Tax=Actinoplanes solisilvae TaxID=2486853 RepID=UPI000FD79017|nr:hypothetical protein [Actinoplanes solisilvae]